MVGVGYITHCSPYSLSHSCGMLDFLEPLKSTIQQQCAQFFSWVESIFNVSSEPYPVRYHGKGHALKALAHSKTAQEQ